jgi:hypothetical protein
MVNLTKAIELAKVARDAAASNIQRRQMNTLVNMLGRVQKGKQLYKSQVCWLPAWAVQEALEMDRERTIRQASAMLAD